MSALWAPIFGAEVVSAQLSDRAWITAMCDVEAALGRACARVGLISHDDAVEIAAACARVESTSAADLGRRSGPDGNPVIPLVKALRAQLAHQPSAASGAHQGATSQDILDTAAMLVTQRAGGVIGQSLQRAATSAAELAERWRDTPMAARTLLQQAVPTTFGAVAAGWGAGLDRVRGLLDDALADQLAVQLGGAGGTLASLHPAGEAVRAALADELGLADPGAVWHTERSRIAILGCALATACGVIGKVATDIVLLAQTEVGEVGESAGGGSSAMPHKQNPVAAVTARAAAAQSPGLAATLLSAMTGELQRAAGAWHSEWQPLTALLSSTGGAAERLAQSLAGLTPRPDRMRANLDATGGLLLAERITAALTPVLGRGRAAEHVASAAASADFRHALLDDPAVSLWPDRLEELLDPTTSLGHATDLVDTYLRRRKP